MLSDYDWMKLCYDKVEEINKKLGSNLKIHSKETGEGLALIFTDTRTTSMDQVNLLPGVYKPVEFYGALMAFEKGLEIQKEEPKEPKDFYGYEKGLLTIEQDLKRGFNTDSSLGIQFSHDKKKVWICIDGSCVLRFKSKSLN